MEGIPDLKVKISETDVYVFQRSSNDIIVKPLNKIEGDIYSNGNLVLTHLTRIVNVNQHYTGHIVYQ